LTKKKVGLEVRSLYKESKMSMPGFGELIVIFLIILVVFGAGRIPKIARDLGSGINEFKRVLSDNIDKKSDSD